MENIKFAINYLIKNKYKLLEDDNNYGNQSIKMAIEALERQIPQKPREHYHWGDFTKEEKLENNQWFCGKCGWQIGEEDNYCNECGQRLDWSVEE